MSIQIPQGERLRLAMMKREIAHLLVKAIRLLSGQQTLAQQGAERIFQELKTETTPDELQLLVQDNFQPMGSTTLEYCEPGLLVTVTYLEGATLAQLKELRRKAVIVPPSVSDLGDSVRPYADENFGNGTGL